jgi:glucan phosphoethanolaminetransferase (alkaline phosphatase superfamily)
LKNRSAIYYYSALFPIWMIAFTIIFLLPIKLMKIPPEQPLIEYCPLWLSTLLLIIALVVGMIVAIFLANRISAKFISKDDMIKIINKNIRPYSPFYSLIIRDVDKVYKKKDT